VRGPLFIFVTALAWARKSLQNPFFFESSCEPHAFLFFMLRFFFSVFPTSGPFPPLLVLPVSLSFFNVSVALTRIDFFRRRFVLFRFFYVPVFTIFILPQRFPVSFCYLSHIRCCCWSSQLPDMTAPLLRFPTSTWKPTYNKNSHLPIPPTSQHPPSFPTFSPPFFFNN